MVLTDERRSEFQRLGDAIRAWAAVRDDVLAIALVGSWVHDAARMDSDIDVVVVTPEPDGFVTSQAWLSDAVGEPATLIRTADWGALTERRVRTASGVEVEFGVVQPSWAATNPVDSGTRRVVNDGCLAWYDPSGLIASLIAAVSDHLATPDQHLDQSVATTYDQRVADRFAPQAIDPAVAVLTELAGDGQAVEFAVGTGRLALPLAAAGVAVHGIDFSEPMLSELRKKGGADRLLTITVGDMTETQVCADATLVYLVFNTITNLRSQDTQVACFANAAAHLRPGGRFLIENGVPKLHQLAPGEVIRPFDLSPDHVGFDEYIDLVDQISVSHHYYIDGDRVRTVSGAFRYVWPSELDLMARLAGMELESRWADWHRNPFTGESPAHVSVWRKT